MGEIVRVTCINQSLHPLGLAHIVIIKPIVTYGSNSRTTKCKAIGHYNCSMDYSWGWDMFIGGFWRNQLWAYYNIWIMYQNTVIVLCGEGSTRSEGFHAPCYDVAISISSCLGHSDNSTILAFLAKQYHIIGGARFGLHWANWLNHFRMAMLVFFKLAHVTAF
jgi:hypothetical protein